MEKIVFNNDIEIPVGLPVRYHGKDIGEVIESIKTAEGHLVTIKLTGDMPGLESTASSISGRISEHGIALPQDITFLD